MFSSTVHVVLLSRRSADFLTARKKRQSASNNASLEVRYQALNLLELLLTIHRHFRLQVAYGYTRVHRHFRLQVAY